MKYLKDDSDPLPVVTGREPDSFHISGTVVIIDMAGFSWTHINNFTPTDLNRIASMIQECFPCRIKAIHVVNQPKIFSIIWNIVR